MPDTRKWRIVDEDMLRSVFPSGWAYTRFLEIAAAPTPPDDSVVVPHKLLRACMALAYDAGDSATANAIRALLTDSAGKGGGE